LIFSRPRPRPACSRPRDWSLNDAGAGVLKRVFHRRFVFSILKIDGFANSPSAALCFTFFLAACLVSTPLCSAFARLAYGAFYLAIPILTFYEIIRIGWWVFSHYFNPESLFLRTDCLYAGIGVSLSLDFHNILSPVILPFIYFSSFKNLNPAGGIGLTLGRQGAT
jgi:hypothetical protein